MSFLSGKKLMLLGFLLVLLIAIPIAAYTINKQLSNSSQVAAETSLSITPLNQTITVGSNAVLDIEINPSSNKVSRINLTIAYDTTKLATTEAGLKILPVISESGKEFTPEIVTGPIYGDGFITLGLITGSNPESYITKPTKIAQLELKAISETESGISASVTFGNQSQTLSYGLFNKLEQNVLSATYPGNIYINKNTDELSLQSSPTPTADNTGLTKTTTSDILGISATPSPTPIENGVICSSLTADPSTSGDAPFSVSLTAIGTSSASPINRINFDFGDGQVQEISDPQSLGVYSISSVVSHTYTYSGSFTAKASITDENGTTSNQDCSVIVAVSENGVFLTPIPSPLEATGPNEILAIGAFGIIAAIIGALLFLAL